MSFSGQWSRSAAKADQGDKLTADKLDTLDEYNEVTIVSAVESTTAVRTITKKDGEQKQVGGKPYLSVTYCLAKNKLNVTIMYFSASDLEPLLVVAKLDFIEDEKQLKGKNLWLKFGKDQKGDSTFVKVVDYKAKNPKGDSGIVGGDLPLGNDDQDGDAVPF